MKEKLDDIIKTTEEAVLVEGIDRFSPRQIGAVRTIALVYAGMFKDFLDDIQADLVDYQEDFIDRETFIERVTASITSYEDLYSR